MKIITRKAEGEIKPCFTFYDEITYNWGKDRQVILPDNGKILKIKDNLFYGELSVIRIEYLFEEKVFHAFQESRLPYPIAFDPDLVLYGKNNKIIISEIDDFEDK